MFGVGWSEMVIVAVVALVVVGPKDLPVLLRSLGRTLGEGRRYIDAFRAQFDEIVREADLDLVRKEMDDMRSAVGKDITPSPGARSRTKGVQDL